MKPVPHKPFNKFYSITEDGNVYSKRREKFLKQFNSGKGYKKVYLIYKREGKKFYIHRLVYETYVERIPEGKQINHIDGDKTNNHVSNLEAVTPKEHGRITVAQGLTQKGKDWWTPARKKALVKSERAKRKAVRKLNPQQVAHIRKLFNTKGWKLKDIAARYGVNLSCIKDIKYGRTWVESPERMVKRIYEEKFGDEENKAE